MSETVAQTSILQVVIDPSGAKSGASEVESALKNATNSTSSFFDKVRSSFQGLESFIKGATLSLKDFVLAVGATYAIKSLIDRLIEVSLVYNQFIATLTLVKGSAKAASAEFQYLSDYSNKLGANLEETTKVYGKLAAALKEFDKTGEVTRHVFESIAQAQAVLHSRGYEVNGIFLALEQIVSKGKVSLEELQRQLGNRLPDAMGITARAMDVTQAKLRQAITKGSIDPLELVIKLANQIKKEYGDAAQGAAELFNAQINRMKNAVFSLYLAIGQTGAIDGLSNVLKSITSILQDSSVGTAFGQSLNDLFSQLAKWISTIQVSDVKDFFDGISVSIKTLITLLDSLVEAFYSTSTEGKSSILQFADFFTSTLLLLTDAVLTFASVILTIPTAVNSVIYDIRLATKKVSFIAGGRTDEDAKELAQLEADRRNAIKLSDTFGDILLGTSNSPTVKAYKRKEELFAQLQSKLPYKPINKDLNNENIGGPLSNEKISELTSNGPGAPIKQTRTRDVFNTESTNLTKLASVALSEYNNLLDNKVKSENSNLIAVNAKILTDKNYIALSDTQKDKLRELAKLADEAQLKEKSAEAFSQTRLELNRQIYQSQQSLIDIEQNRDDLASKSQRSLEEKFRFDSVFIAMTKEMRDALLAQAKAEDQLAVSIRNSQAIKQSAYNTLVDTLNTQRELDNYSKGLGVSKYSDATKTKDSFLPGGSNQFLDAATQSKLLADAVKRDTNSMIRDFNAFKFSQDEVIRNYDLEAENIGKTAYEIEKANNQRKIYDNFRLSGIDLYKEENKEIKQFADNLVSQINTAYDKVIQRQNDWLLGAKEGIASYINSTQNLAKDVSNAFSNAFNRLEDVITNFITSGKLKFKDFANSIISDVTRIIVKTNITGPLANSLAGAFTGSVGSSGAQAGSGTAGTISGLGSIANSVSSLFGGASALGANFVTSGIGQSLGLSTALDGGFVFSGLGSAIASIGTALPYIGGALAAYKLGTSAFGHKPREITGTTISGTLGTDDISRIDEYVRKGGIFSKTKRGTFDYNLATSAAVADGKTYVDTGRQAENTALLKSLNDAYTALKTSSADYAKALGLDASSIADRTDKISYAIGKTADETQANFVKAIGLVSDDIANSILGSFSELKKEGETSSQTLTRLATNLTAVNATFQHLGLSLYTLDVNGSKAAESIVSAFGSLDNFVNVSKSYYDNFYTESEKTAIKTQELTKAFADAGLVLPQTREGFRAAVEVAKAMGDNATLAKLLNLSSAFAEVVAPIEDLTDSIKKMQEEAKAAYEQSVSNAKNDLLDAYNAESQSIQSVIDRLKNFKANLDSFIDSSKLNDASLSPEAKFLEAERQYKATLAKASTGDETAQGQLTSIAQVYLDANKAYNASTQAANDVFNSVQNELTKLSTSTGQQISAQQLQLEQLKTQVSQLITIDKSVLSVKDAINNLTKLLAGGPAGISSNEPVPGGGGFSGEAGQAIADEYNKVKDYGDKYGKNAYYFLKGINDLTGKLDAAQSLYNFYQQYSTDESVKKLTPDDLLVQTTGHTRQYWEAVQAAYDAGLHPTSDFVLQNSSLTPASAPIPDLLPANLSSPYSESAGNSTMAELETQTETLTTLVKVQQYSNKQMLDKIDDMTEQLSAIKKKANLSAAEA